MREGYLIFLLVVSLLLIKMYIYIHIQILILILILSNPQEFYSLYFSYYSIIV